MALAMAAFAGCTTADQSAVGAAARISDRTYESAANRLCRDAVHTFDVATTLPKEPSRAQSADLLDRIDATFADLVHRLHLLRPAAADQVAVDGWLRDWDAFVSFGQTYAAAVRTGTERDLIRNNATAQGTLRRRLQAFATANHMDSCHFL